MESSSVQAYVTEITAQLRAGQAREHGYRPALERLMRSFEDTGATNDPKRSEHGNPDFIFWKESNHDVILGYAEAKDVSISLDKTAKTEQLHRYAGYNKLFLTNYLEFRFYKNGEEYEQVTIGTLKNGGVEFHPAEFARLNNELYAFLQLPPEPIKNGKRLALVMGQKARRIRDNVVRYLGAEDDKSQELERIYTMMKNLLVHDLSQEKFADMYAQTLVYGLFAARYHDNTPNNFTRQEASELVPASNPFLREFFAHIGGIHFDKRLAVVVDELCDVFAVSDVQMLVQKHLRILQGATDKDSIIHFYEDFLKEYDPAERKRMGAYYTPVPVVQFIVHQVDRILKEEFGLSAGLADTSKITREIDHGQELRIRNQKTGRLQKTSIEQRSYHRVQILDPAVGTATFLNETIKFIAQKFEGQEGRWPSYVNDDLLPRLSGFELMMAPYTVAHLKLALTLQETGAGELQKRLGIYLTNTLEEGIPRQQDLFNSLGLAAAVTEESAAASEIKHERPVMVVMGNPPYSASSNNKSNFARDLIAPYKKDLNERKINLEDDYIKFIAFAENMVAKNSSGVVAMITNNSYLDGVTHRQMRKHLLQTFDKIYLLDLHGSHNRREVAADGSSDENIFDIKQGVSIILAVKTTSSSELAEVYHAELFGKRKVKFTALLEQVMEFKKRMIIAPNYSFAEVNTELQKEYDSHVGLSNLFIVNTSGIETQRDDFVIKRSQKEVEGAVTDLITLPEDILRAKHNIGPDGRNWKISTAKSDVGNEVDFSKIIPIAYRPFDIRFMYYTGRTNGIAAWPRFRSFAHMLHAPNISLIFERTSPREPFANVFISEEVSDGHLLGTAYSKGYAAPLYLYHEDGTRTPNFDPETLKQLTNNLTAGYQPEDILDYIYAILHSPNYRTKYKEFLKIDFPRVPAPANDTEFIRIVTLGRQLRDLHLMKSPLLDTFDTTYPVAGNNVVEKPVFADNKVYINETQYFGNAPESAWNFHIGGYQPAQKWLKDRKGRALSNADLEHYQKIVKILIETKRIVEKIDPNYS